MAGWGVAGQEPPQDGYRPWRLALPTSPGRWPDTLSNSSVEGSRSLLCMEGCISLFGTEVDPVGKRIAFFLVMFRRRGRRIPKKLKGGGGNNACKYLVMVYRKYWNSCLCLSDIVYVSRIVCWCPQMRFAIYFSVIPMYCSFWFIHK